MSVLSQWQLKQPSTKNAQIIALLTLLWIALPLLNPLPIGVALLFGLLLLVRVGMTMVGIGGLPTWLNLVLVLIAGGAVYAQLHTVFGQEGGVSLLLLMVMLKSFEGQTTRDWQVLLVACLFLVAGGLLFQQSLQIGLWLVVALLFVFLSLSLLNGMKWPQAWRNTLWALGLSWPLMLTLFLLMPRFSEPLWRLPSAQAMTKTGLSTELTMGDMAQVIESNELAFNVSFSKGSIPRANQLYWRVMVMNDYDGQTWHANTQQTWLQDAYTNLAGERVSYDVTLRDFQGHIPALEQVTTMDDSLVLREHQVVFAKRPYAQLRKITLSSTLTAQIPERLSPAQQRLWLRLPAGQNPQAHALAKTWRQQHQSDHEIVQAALDYFNTQGFVYTLAPGVLTQDGSQVDQFLFQRKQGFCEHYASSLVVLMRAAGIPARLVTGYLGGSYNENGQFWQVRGKDAHAWVEVWLAEQQHWQRVDPTAAVSSRRIDDGINAALPEQMSTFDGVLPAPLQNWLATSQYYWQQWVINYDASSQKAMFANLGVGALTVGKWLLMAALGIVLTISPMAWWWRRQYRQRINPLSMGFLRIKQHFLGEDSEEYGYFGALNLEIWLRQQGRLTPPLQQLLQQYNRLRYGQEHTTEQQKWQWYRHIKRALKTTTSNR